MRIVCLSAETADLCARLGAWDDVVAVSVYADQTGLPPKPVASGFSAGCADRILKFAPDLVLGYSDVQAELAGRLIREGANVLITNQRTLPEIGSAMRMVAGAIGRARGGEEMVAEFEREVAALRGGVDRNWRVYFEEWPEPAITGIGWIGEIIEALGCSDVFADRRGRSARERLVTDEEILHREPEIILASWCGKAVDHASLRARLGSSPAGRADRIFEISSDEILQPGMRLLRGVRALETIFKQAR